MRLIGGLAVRFHCHGSHSLHLREYNDIDMFGLKQQYKKIFLVLQGLGYSPNVKFNFLYGESRLQFLDLKKGKNIDIFLDEFKMDHKIDFKKRLNLDDLTIPVTDLLLTKLQIVKLTQKDMKDIIAIVEDHEIGYRDNRETLNLNHIADLCSGDWGLHKTIKSTLSNVIKSIEMGTVNAIYKKELLSKLEIIKNAIDSKKRNCDGNYVT